MTLPALAAGPPFGGRPAYPDPRRADVWRLCRYAFPRPGWQDDASGVPPTCRACGRSITPTAYRSLVGATAHGEPLYAYVRTWRHLPIRRRTPIYGEGAQARPLAGYAR
jgi:hypothetical protein